MHTYAVLISVGVVALISACEHPVGVAKTTGATVSNDSAVLQVAQARCRRAAECNHIGNGMRFASERQCIDAYLDVGADLTILRTCPAGVDRARLDRCVATLQDQHCDANLGPLTAMPDCGSYCASTP